MNMMTHGGVTAPSNITEIAENTSATCLSTRIRQLNRIITRVYDDAMRPLGITASQFTLLTQLAQQDGITAVEIGHTLDIEKSTLSRNLKRLLKDGHITMDPKVFSGFRQDIYGLMGLPNYYRIETETNCLGSASGNGDKP